MIDLCIRKRFTSKGTVYEYRFEIASINGKRKWKSKSGFKTVTEARKAGRATMAQYENYGHIVKDNISVSDFFDVWFENDCMVDLKVTTLTSYKKSIETILKPRLGLYRLKSLTRELLQKFLVEMYDNGYSQNSLVSIKALLTKSMNYAVDNHYIMCSPAVRLKTPRNRIPKIPTRSAPHHFIKPEIMQKVFNRFPERTSSFIPLKIAYECGLRLGESFALCWEDIDLENKIIYINRQVQWFTDKQLSMDNKTEDNDSAKGGNGYWYFCAPKYNSYRIIEISDELAELLFQEKKRQTKAKEYYESRYHLYSVNNELTFNGKPSSYNLCINKINSGSTGFPVHFVCVRENGTFITPRTLQNTSRIIKIEIFQEFDYHSLRHTHASMLAEMGVDQKYIQTRLGHTDIGMTFDIYEHTTDLMRNRGKIALNSIFRSKNTIG